MKTSRGSLTDGDCLPIIGLSFVICQAACVLCNFTGRCGTGEEGVRGRGAKVGGGRWRTLRGNSDGGGNGGGRGEGGGCRVIEASLVAARVMTGPDCVWFRPWRL